MTQLSALLLADMRIYPLQSRDRGGTDSPVAGAGMMIQINVLQYRVTETLQRLSSQEASHGTTYVTNSGRSLRFKASLSVSFKLSIALSEASCPPVNR